MKKLFILLCLCLSFHAKAFETTPFNSESSFSLSPSDQFRFGRFWKTIQPYVVSDQLPDLIQCRREEIRMIKEHWRTPIETCMRPENPQFYETLDSTLQNGNITLVDEGMAGTYFLHDAEGIVQFVIKPVDEGILCLNNRKYYASPLNDPTLRVRPQIPLYKSCQTDALASEIASLCNIPQVTPKTIMAIIEEDLFYDLSDNSAFSSTYSHLKDKEKLCSVQQYLPVTIELYDAIQIWLENNWNGEQIARLIDQSDFEEAMIFVWLCYDTDAHAGNFLLYAKDNHHYGIRKIDNTLCFPEKNKGLKNSLSYLPNAEFRLSERAKAVIRSIPKEAIIHKMHFYEMDTCIEAFDERMTILQELINHDNMALKDIDLRLSFLEYPDGKEFALSSLPRENLEDILEEKKNSLPFGDLFGTTE